jgi:hypothetical protein
MGPADNYQGFPAGVMLTYPAPRYELFESICL